MAERSQRAQLVQRFILRGEDRGGSPPRAVTARARTEEGKSSDVLGERQRKLESLLKGRPTRAQLHNLNVIQETEVPDAERAAHQLTCACAQSGTAPNDEFLQRVAERDRRKNELETLLSKRPAPAELTSRKILLPTEAQRAINVRAGTLACLTR